MVAKMDAQRALLKHFLAAIAYRTQKALRGAPATGYRKKPFLVSRFSLGTIAPNEKRETSFPSAEQLLQGPLADTMTHVGQLAMLRRLASSPVPPENFVRAKISASNLGPDQPAPAAPDPGWSPDLPPPAPGKGVPPSW
jgi:hypothetical protein